uniref:DUF6377 domain-containing protein n=1 Tax=Bacteroides ovatus TaxID=28116 RepID=UPI00359C847E
MQNVKLKYSFVFWVISFILTSMFYIGCAQGRQVKDKKDIEKKMSLALQQKGMYRQKKMERTDSIKALLHANKKAMSKKEMFKEYVDLYNEFKLYSFDSAYHYATQLCKIANEINQPNYQVAAKTQLGYILARGGFFKEAIDTLSSIQIEKDSLPDIVLSNYYISFGRAYHDMADYTKDDVFSVKYNKLGNDLLYKSLSHLTDSLTIYYVKGKIALKEDKIEKAKLFYQQALHLCDTTDSETRSILLSTMAFIDRKLELNDEAIDYYVEAAINDIHSAINESVSLRGLATILYYYKNEVDLASEYINEAFEDATFYGTRHRMNVIGTLLPVFVGEKLDIEKVKRQTFQDSFILSSIFTIVLIIAIVYILIQMKRLRRSRELQEGLNLKLAEANRIKNSYIGHYLDTTFKLVNQLDKFVLIGQQKLDNKQYDSLYSMIHNLNLEYNRKNTFADFDQTFLSLFPTFVESFNALLQPEDQFIIDNKSSLNSTLRIFALIRLGIIENEQISNILGYSVNTVYNYRVRTRNKATEPKNFEENVKKIGL